MIHGVGGQLPQMVMVKINGKNRVWLYWSTVSIVQELTIARKSFRATREGLLTRKNLMDKFETLLKLTDLYELLLYD